MRRVLLVLTLFVLALPLAAQNSGASANGNFNFTASTLGANTIVFDARVGPNGDRGEIDFTGPAEIPADQDVDGSGDADLGGNVANLAVHVEVDCVQVNGNRAVVSGPITSASLAHLVGRRAILAVEDGGEGKNEGPDRFTWGVYRQHAPNWTPSDAELVFDNGAFLTWIATDAERTDDVGVPSQQVQSQSVDCHSFSLAAYALQDLAHGAGNIQVRP